MASILVAPLKVSWAGRAVFLFESLKASPAHVHSGRIFSIKRVVPTYFSHATYPSLLPWDMGLLYF